MKTSDPWNPLKQVTHGSKWPMKGMQVGDPWKQVTHEINISKWSMKSIEASDPWKLWKWVTHEIHGSKWPMKCDSWKPWKQSCSFGCFVVKLHVLMLMHLWFDLVTMRQIFNCVLFRDKTLAPVYHFLTNPSIILE